MSNMSDARKALEEHTPPTPRRHRQEDVIWKQLELGEALGGVAGLAGDEVLVRGGIDGREGVPVCFLTSWDADNDVVATVAFNAQGVAALVALLTAFSVDL